MDDSASIDFTNDTFFDKGEGGGLLIADGVHMFLLDNEARGNARKTCELYGRYCGLFQKFEEQRQKRYVHEITGPDVTEFLLTFRRKNCKPGHIKLIRTVIRVFLNFMIDAGYLDKMPKIAQIKYRPERLYVPTIIEWQTIMQALGNPRDQLMLMLMCDTGVRLAECSQLTWGDVDFQTQILTIRRGKGGKSRRVAMGSTLTKSLLAYRTHLVGRGYSVDDDSILFITSTGNPLGRTGIVAVWRRVSEKTGIKCSSHAWRRFYAKNAAVAQGMPLEVLRESMGHSSLETTALYLGRLTDADLQSARRHSPVDGLKRIDKKRG